MKRCIWLVNVAILLGLIAIPRTVSIQVSAQGRREAVYDGTGGSRAPSVPRVTPMPLTEEGVSPQELPSYMALVYMSDRAGNWNIHRFEGGGTTRLTSHSATDWTPAPFSGGNPVVFVSHRDGNPELYVVDYDGTNERRLTYTPAEEWYPKVRPDNARIVFSSDADGDHDIYVMDVDGGNAIQLTHNDVHDSEPSFSPDGRRIVFTRITDASSHEVYIYIMNADGSGQRRLIDKPATAEDYYPVFGAQGEAVFFTRYDAAAGTENVYQYTLATGATRNLTQNQGRNWAPDVSPDGQYIAFSSTRSGESEVWVMRSDGSAAQNISQNPQATDRWVRFAWPLVAVEQEVSAGQVGLGGFWHQASTWLLPIVPSSNSLVWIPPWIAVTISDGPPTGPRKIVRRLTVLGTLTGSCDVPVEARDGITVGAIPPLVRGLITAGNRWHTQQGCTVDLRAWPNGTITINGAVTGGTGLPDALDKDGGPVHLLAKTVVVNGSVSGGNGASLPARGLYGLTFRQAGNGGAVTVNGESIAIGPTGLVAGGWGGDTDPRWTDPECARYRQNGGDGGSVFLGSGALVSYGGTRNLTVQGGAKVYGGKGGDVIGRHAGYGGRGGDATLSAQLVLGGVVNVASGAWVSGGNGGGRPIVVVGGEWVPMVLDHPVWGGNGGDVNILARASVAVGANLNVRGAARPPLPPALGPLHQWGGRGWGERETCCNPGIRECGGDGFPGDVTIHPPTIVFSNSARVNGNNIWIYGGEGWGIDLTRVEPGAIVAADSITVAVEGGSGQIDLRGHSAGESILTARRGISLYGNASQIKLDPGVSTDDLTDPLAQVAPGRALYRGRLYAEADTVQLAGTTATIRLTLTNLGSNTDTFDFTAQDSESWSWLLSPGSLSLDAMAEKGVVATAAIPPDAVQHSNEITFSARSRADPTQAAMANLSLYVTEIWKAYLPCVLNGFGP